MASTGVIDAWVLREVARGLIGAGLPEPRDLVHGLPVGDVSTERMCFRVGPDFPRDGEDEKGISAIDKWRERYIKPASEALASLVRARGWRTIGVLPLAANGHRSVRYTDEDERLSVLMVVSSEPDGSEVYAVEMFGAK